MADWIVHRLRRYCVRGAAFKLRVRRARFSCRAGAEAARDALGSLAAILLARRFRALRFPERLGEIAPRIAGGLDRRRGRVVHRLR